MTFKDALVFLYKYLGQSSPSKAAFITDMCGHLIPMDACEKYGIFDKDIKYLDGFFSFRILPIKYAQLFIADQQPLMLQQYISTILPSSSDRLDELSEALSKQGYSNDGSEESIAKSCTSLFIESINERLSKKTDVKASRHLPALSDDTIRKLDDIIGSLPVPTQIPVPSTPLQDENEYIKELYRAYSDATNGTTIDETNIDKYPEYADDLRERRIHYFAAESIKEGIKELNVSGMDGQFDVLKSETYNGVKDVERRPSANGYVRMLDVMTQAANTPTKEYLLSRSPYWISNEIKKGVCHFLVNEDRLKWVK